MTTAHSIYKTIKSASPSSKAEVGRVFGLLRAGKVGALMRERHDKIGAAKPSLSGTMTTEVSGDDRSAAQ